MIHIAIHIVPRKPNGETWVGWHSRHGYGFRPRVFEDMGGVGAFVTADDSSGATMG